MKITMAQINPTIGDIRGGIKRISEILSDFGHKTDLVVFPELSLTGYPPRDILESPGFIKKVQKAIEEIIGISKKYPETGILFGVPMISKKGNDSRLYNSAVLVSAGKKIGACHKSLLPAYDVFDETRYFNQASNVDVIPFKGQKLGISICEDMWGRFQTESKVSYSVDPVEILAGKGATLFINLSASPFQVGKEDIRYKIVCEHAKKYNVPFLMVNQVGGNDELIFDGRSLAVDSSGELIKSFPAFSEHVETVDVKSSQGSQKYVSQEKIETVYKALVLGVKDYVRKCGFSKTVVGLSGGIDSAVTCVLARKALGADNVLGISMPSPYSAEESEQYSKMLAENLGIQYKVVSISEIYFSYIETLKEKLDIKKNGDVGIYLQNVQARIRGNILMSFSNKFNYLLLTTGNKSELAVGYCTLYGDMAGGLAVISDVPKTMVYELANYINREGNIIPRQIIERAPSAELKPDQLDEDTLPPYDVLDKILYHYVEEKRDVHEIIELGFDKKTVFWVIKAVNRNEYKRRQASPGLKVTSKAFGMGRRMPIAVADDINM